VKAQQEGGFEGLRLDANEKLKGGHRQKEETGVCGKGFSG